MRQEYGFATYSRNCRNAEIEILNFSIYIHTVQTLKHTTFPNNISITISCVEVNLHICYVFKELSESEEYISRSYITSHINHLMYE